MTLRIARATDRPAIAALQCASWQDTYRGVLPDSFLDHDLPAHLDAQWAATRFDGDERTLVWEEQGMLLGFASLIPKAEPYLYNIHASPGHRGQGIGARLMAGAAAWAQTHGTTLYLHALAGNHGARRFYARLGGTEGPGFDETLFGQPVHTIPIRWTDLAKLIARCQTPR